MSMYKQGYVDALSSLGMDKVAVRVGYRSPFIKRVGNWFRKKAPTKTGIRNMLIGDPKRFAREIASGRPIRGYKGQGRTMIRDSFYAPDMLSKMMFYGLPAVETAGIALDDEGDKAKRIGGSLGGAALGLAAYRPLGMVGSIGADMIGRSLGGGIGKTVEHLGNKVTGGNTIPQPVKQDPQNLSLGIQ